MRAGLLRLLIEVIVMFLEEFFIPTNVPQDSFVWIDAHVFKRMRFDKFSFRLLRLCPLTLIFFLADIIDV